MIKVCLSEATFHTSSSETWTAEDWEKLHLDRRVLNSAATCGESGGNFSVRTLICGSTVVLPLLLLAEVCSWLPLVWFGLNIMCCRHQCPPPLQLSSDNCFNLEIASRAERDLNSHDLLNPLDNLWDEVKRGNRHHACDSGVVGITKEKVFQLLLAS